MNKYGRLYDWEIAKTACPSGWKLPTDEEWSTLTSYIESEQNCSECAAKYLKSADGWSGTGNSGNGLDTYGFAALPGGVGVSSTSILFSGVGSSGGWWSASEKDDGNAYFRSLYNMEYLNRDDNIKSVLYSVRCIKIK